MQNKTNRSIRTDKYRYRHFERTPRTTPPSPRRGGECRSQNGTIAIRKPMTPQYHSHECRRFIFGRKRYRNLHESPKRTTTTASRDESEIEPEIKGFRLSVGHRHTAIRSTAPRDLHAAGPPPEPSVRSNSSSGSNPRTPPPKQYPAISCAEKLRPDETKIPKTTTNRMKIYSFRILQIEIFYLVLSKCFPLMEKRPDHYRPKPNRMGTSTIVYTIFARRMRHASTRRSEGIIPPPIGI